MLRQHCWVDEAAAAVQLCCSALQSKRIMQSTQSTGTVGRFGKLQPHCCLCLRQESRLSCLCLLRRLILLVSSLLVSLLLQGNQHTCFTEPADLQIGLTRGLAARSAAPVSQPHAAAHRRAPVLRTGQAHLSQHAGEQLTFKGLACWPAYTLANPSRDRLHVPNILVTSQPHVA